MIRCAARRHPLPQQARKNMRNMHTAQKVLASAQAMCLQVASMCYMILYCNCNFCRVLVLAQAMKGGEGMLQVDAVTAELQWQVARHVKCSASPGCLIDTGV
jgi:hypothetical protein